MRFSPVVRVGVLAWAGFAVAACSGGADEISPWTIVDVGGTVPDTACVQGREAACGRSVPAAITYDWYRRHIARCDWDRHRSSCLTLWRAVRDRADLVEALIGTIRDPAADPRDVDDALTRLGATQQERAYDFLLSYTPTQRESTARMHAVQALGFGDRPVPERVYRALERTLRTAEMPEREGAVSALYHIGTRRAREILSSRARTETFPRVRRVIAQRLAHWQPRPEREGSPP